MFPGSRAVKCEFANCFTLQNGVADYGLGVSPQQTDAAKRPGSLEVSAANGYATKGVREKCEDLDDGSLPCTPELMSDSEADVSSCPAGDEVLDYDTQQLIGQFLAEHAGLSPPRWKRSSALSTMKRVVRSLLDKHAYSFNGMISRLSLDAKADDMSFVGAVAATLFADGVTNWGRVASLVAFGAAVSQHLKETHRDNCVELVGQEICTYLLTQQRDWLLKNNSWDGFVDFFRVSNMESTVMKSLMAVAGVAGIGATLALLIR